MRCLLVAPLFLMTVCGVAQADWLEKLQSLGDELKNKASSNWVGASTLLQEAKKEKNRDQDADLVLDSQKSKSLESWLDYDQSFLPAMQDVTNFMGLHYRWAEERTMSYSNVILSITEPWKKDIIYYSDQNKEWYNELWKTASVEYVKGQSIILVNIPSRETATDAVFSTVVFGTLVGVSATICSVPVARVGGPALAAIAGGMCAGTGLYIANQNVEYLHSFLFDRPIDQTGRNFGSVVGTTIGAIAAGKFTVGSAVAAGRSGQGYYSAAYKATYRKKADRLKDITYNLHKNTIDPSSLRGRQYGYDLDHIIPVKCFYNLGLPVFLTGVKSNLQMLSASKNRSKGAAGC